MSTLKHILCFLFSAKGRISRTQYWGCLIGCGITFNLTYIFGLHLINTIFPGVISNLEDDSVTILLVAPIGIYIITIFAVIKRLHDLNLKGWWILTTIPIPFSPLLPIGVIVLGCIKGTQGKNRFGDISQQRVLLP